mmetsp:Transcript_201/g.403  ORF Transcript_201/g.403 Transcript_201/m.403 type:complete len:294 (+) Transcript_201:913-1794(+)
MMPDIPPSIRYRGSSRRGLLKSKSPSRNASSLPSRSCMVSADTTDDSKIALILICCNASASPPTVDICILSSPSKSGTFSSFLEGKSTETSAFCTISRAKKTPLNGALNPALTPAAAPHANNDRSRDIFLFTLSTSLKSLSSKVPNTADSWKNTLLFISKRLMLMPDSTDGPSGPRLFPVPRVAVAARALREKRRKSLRSDGGGMSFVHDMSSIGGVALEARMESRSTSFTVSLSPGGISPPNLNKNATTNPPKTGIADDGTDSLSLKESCRIPSPPEFHNAELNNGSFIPSP